MTKSTITTLLFCLVLVLAFCLLLFALFVETRNEGQKIGKKKKYKGKNIIDTMNHRDWVQNFGKMIPSDGLQKIFNRAKNPWHMNIPTFQCIRYGGLIVGIVGGAITLPTLPWQIGAMFLLCGGLAWYYPMYYYKAIGNEREAEWNKMYEFIWVIKHNIMLYDPAKAYMNVKIYIEQHAPHDKELIQGFEDFYVYWNEDGIDPYIEQYYPFSIPREITQILFNMTKTGEFPEEQLNSLRQFIINTQDLSVEKILSGVSSKATIFSLPFLMITVIVCLMVPLLLQIVSFMT